MFKKILVANRGEIAVRVIRACREMGIESVAVFSEADRTALHVRQADYAMALGPAPASESYLNTSKIIAAARHIGADAIHPGYGFLAESPAFARAISAAGLTFIGPPADAIEKMGDKLKARKLMAAAGVPVVDGSAGTLETADQVAEVAARIGFPIMIKAVAGGGGKGMRRVESAKDIASAVRAVSSEAESFFGDGRLYVEKFLNRPRHIEIQLLADSSGHTVHLFERECSIQRRHQKVVEESPSPFVTPPMRAAMGDVAIRAAKAAGYAGAGTVEFLVDAERNFYFLEVNTRIQVEHPVTEMVTGIDLVQAQIAIAQGLPLDLTQDQIDQRGWSIECRVYAEDPEMGFVPSPGRIETLRLPEGPGVRNDIGVYAGADVPVYYDPIVSKLIVWGHDRGHAIERMRRALEEYLIAGDLRTNLSFHRWLMDEPSFIEGDYDNRFVEQTYRPQSAERESDPARMAAMLAAAVVAHQGPNGANGQPEPATAAVPTSQWRSFGRIEGLRS